MKRDADNVMDALVAEDIGKFPDQNLPESLQRVSGVAIDRMRGEGAQVSIRGLGPQFTREGAGTSLPVRLAQGFDPEPWRLNRCHEQDGINLSRRIPLPESRAVLSAASGCVGPITNEVISLNAGSTESGKVQTDHCGLQRLGNILR